MKRFMFLIVAACGYSAPSPVQYFASEFDGNIPFVRFPEGDYGLKVDCMFMPGNSCHHKIERICRSGYTVVDRWEGVIQTQAGTRDASYTVRCWNRMRIWMDWSPVKPCSNGGVSTGKPIQFSREPNGGSVAFAQRADVAEIMRAFALYDPAFRYHLMDDWVRASCWGGAWRTDNPFGFLRYLRDYQGAVIERRGDGSISIRRPVNSFKQL
jgi:hypothetical protein